MGATASAPTSSNPKGSDRRRNSSERRPRRPPGPTMNARAGERRGRAAPAWHAWQPAPNTQTGMSAAQNSNRQQQSCADTQPVRGTVCTSARSRRVRQRAMLPEPGPGAWTLVQSPVVQLVSGNLRAPHARAVGPERTLVHVPAGPQRLPHVGGQAGAGLLAVHDAVDRRAPRALPHAARAPLAPCAAPASRGDQARTCRPAPDANQRPVISWISLSAAPNDSMSASTSAGSSAISTRYATRSTSPSGGDGSSRERPRLGRRR